MKNKRSKAPVRKGTLEAFNAPAAQSFNKSTLRFCLRHLQKDFDISALDAGKQADFALALQRRARLTWEQVLLAPRHGLGTENIPSSQIKPAIPEDLAEREHFLVMRYSGKLPMVGFRTADTFHMVWIEAAFGDVYDHGN